MPTSDSAALTTTPEQRSEFRWMFLALLPFYLFLLPAGGWLQALGFLYAGAIAGYGFYLSPHRRTDAAARASLREVPVVFLWIMAVLWGVLPLGWWGQRIGIALLAATVGYVLSGSPRRHGDVAEDWGLGSWARTRALWAKPDERWSRWAFIAFNVAILLACALTPDFASDVARGVLRRCLGVKVQEPLPALPVALVALVCGNALLGAMRWDNMRAAWHLVGLYLAGLALLIGAGGGLYVYAWSGGWVWLDPVRGAASMLSYTIWGLLQELLFLGYFNTRIRKGVDSPLLAAMLTSVVFSLFHLKAYALTFLCFLVMHAWALIFQAAPNLFALALAHGISGGFGGLFHLEGFTPVKIKGSVGPFNP